MSKIDETLAEIDEKRAEVEGWRATADAIEAIASEFTKPELRVSIGYEFSSLKGVLLMTDITDMKEMIPIFRRLRSVGYKVKTHEDTGDMNCRTYTMEYVNEGCPAPLVVHVERSPVSLAASSSSSPFRMRRKRFPSTN